jgi:DNA-binding transcriptional regulator YdaS (Cro superfamily)
MLRFFQVTPPTVHQMVLTLQQVGWISRKPGIARSIVGLVDRTALPQLNLSRFQSVKTTSQRPSCVVSLTVSGMSESMTTSRNDGADS